MGRPQASGVPGCAAALSRKTSFPMDQETSLDNYQWRYVITMTYCTGRLILRLHQGPAGNSHDLCRSVLIPGVGRLLGTRINIGAGGSFTPAHIDPCASYGQNLLLYADTGASAIWYVTCIFCVTSCRSSLNTAIQASHGVSRLPASYAAYQGDVQR